MCLISDQGFPRRPYSVAREMHRNSARRGLPLASGGVHRSGDGPALEFGELSRARAAAAAARCRLLGPLALAPVRSAPARCGEGCGRAVARPACRNRCSWPPAPARCAAPGCCRASSARPAAPARRAAPRAGPCRSGAQCRHPAPSTQRRDVAAAPHAAAAPGRAVRSGGSKDVTQAAVMHQRRQSGARWRRRCAHQTAPADWSPAVRSRLPAARAAVWPAVRRACRRSRPEKACHRQPV